MKTFSMRGLFYFIVYSNITVICTFLALHLLKRFFNFYWKLEVTFYFGLQFSSQAVFFRLLSQQ